MKNGASEELLKYWIQYTNLCLIDGILYRKHRTEPNFDTVYKMLIPWERASNVLELLHDSPSAGHFGTEKTYHWACEKFYWGVHERGRKKKDRKLLCLPKSRNIGIHSQNGNLVINFSKYLLISWVHFPSLREKSTFCLFVINSVSGTKS